MELNQNILFAYDDYVANSTVVSSTGTVSGFPVAYSQNDIMWKPCKFQGNVTDTIFDMGEDQAVDMIAILKHNLLQNGKWRARLSNDPTFPSSIYDSGWRNALPSTSGFGALSWGSFDWGGMMPLRFIEKYNRHAYLPLPETVVARYLRIEIDASADAPDSDDSVIQVGRFWASAGYQPSLNVSYGAKMLPEDATNVQKSRSMSRTYDKFDPRMRSMQVNFEELPHKEYLYSILGPMYMRGGKRQALIVMLFPTDEETWFAEALYGNFANTEAHSHVFFNYVSNGMLIEEAV